MAEIVGTITNLSDFLSKTQVCLSVKPNDPQQQIICLEADRKYSIPAFQREVRWDDNNLKMLLYDLSRSSKFLGNIILTIKSDHTCEIIDGQQRTTVLMLIVSCIKKKFGTKISTPDLCPLRNEGFTGFQTLLEKAFDQEAITSDDWNAILKSDDYLQLPRIQKLWNTISSSELLADRHKAQGLLDNLCKSEFNIIASYSNDVNTSIQYFLDVNLKGIRLDTEDIFKGYLFSQDSRELTRSLWQKNKRDVLRLNGVTQSSEEKRYPLMKLYEHFFYCDLYLPREGDCEYSTLKFGENFCLTSGFESGSTKYYEGSHLIEAIRDRDYLQNVLSRLNKCVEIMTDIIESEGPSTPFKDKFICAKKVDSIDIQNCHSMLKKILMEKEVIPKILALKYILTYFDGKPHAKEEYKSVYSVFCAAVLFTVFANKKESDTFYNFVRLEEWKSKINKWLYDYISSHALTRGKVLAAYKYSESDDDPIQQIRCKSLAAISNFFKVTKNGDNYNMGISNAAELCKFFGDKTVYSLEHFIVGECGTLHVKTAKYDFPYKYPPTIQKYRNSLFNFIFIPQPLNSSLSNEGLFIKVAEIHTHENEIKCSYSKGYYGLLNKSPRMYFQRYWNDLRLLKETVRNALNRAERREFFSDAQDSTSCLTALLHFKDTPNVEFSFDVAITTKNKNGNYMRLIHNKNVYALGLDQYTWNEVPNSHQVKDRADKLKRAGLWQKVRDRYLEKKNMYLFRQDHNHPSFVVYVEAVNEVYSRYFNRGGGYSVQSIF